MLDVAHLLVDLEGQEEGEKELVILVETPAGVPEDFVRQLADDVGNPLGWDGGFLRPEKSKRDGD